MTNALNIQFTQLYDSRTKEGDQHELSRSWEMAYISYWSILEEGLKLYASPAVKERLRLKLNQWADYLNNNLKDTPKEIRNFDTEYKSDSIPQIELIELMLGKMPCVEKIIEPKKKWRNRRNDIAHRAIKFVNEAKYLEYKTDIQQAINELKDNITSQ